MFSQTGQIILEWTENDSGQVIQQLGVPIGSQRKADTCASTTALPKKGSSSTGVPDSQMFGSQAVLHLAACSGPKCHCCTVVLFSPQSDLHD